MNVGPAVKFNDIRIGDCFRVGEKDYLKMSATTARMGPKNKVFFFKQQDVVLPLSWLL